MFSAKMQISALPCAERLGTARHSVECTRKPQLAGTEPIRRLDGGADLGAADGGDERLVSPRVPVADDDLFGLKLVHEGRRMAADQQLCTVGRRSQPLDQHIQRKMMSSKPGKQSRMAESSRAKPSGFCSCS